MVEYVKPKMRGLHMKNMSIWEDGREIGKVGIVRFEDSEGNVLDKYESGCIIVCENGILCKDCGDWTYKTEILWDGIG